MVRKPTAGMKQTACGSQWMWPSVMERAFSSLPQWKVTTARRKASLTVRWITDVWLKGLKGGPDRRRSDLNRSMRKSATEVIGAKVGSTPRP